jgi:hypothetical protein
MNFFEESKRKLENLISTNCSMSKAFCIQFTLEVGHKRNISSMFDVLKKT